MTRKAPPSRPRGAKWPHYQRLDGSFVYVAKGREDPPPQLAPDTDSDLIQFEKVFADFVAALDRQRFNYEDDENGDLRQYWCPHCDEITAAVGWHCENCGEWFNVGDIKGQLDKPDVKIPYEVAWSLFNPFMQILWGRKADHVFELKKRKNRKRGEERYFQRQAAYLVHELGDRMSPYKACKKVSDQLADENGYPEPRIISKWYKKYYPKK